MKIPLCTDVHFFITANNTYQEVVWASMNSTRQGHHLLVVMELTTASMAKLHSKQEASLQKLKLSTLVWQMESRAWSIAKFLPMH